MRTGMNQRTPSEVVAKLAAHTQKINLLADKAWLDRIDEYRKQQGFPTPTRSDAIRQLVDHGLDAVSKASDKPKPKPKRT